MDGSAGDGDSHRRVIWVVLAIGCLSGLSTYVVTPLAQPDQVMLATDVYRHAVQSWLAGDGLYGVAPPDRGGYTFLYPPVTLLVFLPHALSPTLTIAYVLQTASNVLAAIALAVLVERGLHDRDIPLGPRERVGLVAFMVLSSYTAIQVLNGQITVWLGVAVAAGFHLIDRDREDLAGSLFALAALFKVFPAILGLWLVRLRARRAVVAALATGVAGLALGAILFGPELTASYLLEVLPGRFTGSTYATRPDPTDNVDGVQRQLAAVWPNMTDAGRTALGFGIVAPLTAVTTFRVDGILRRDIAALGVIVSILLFLPLQPLYFPLIVFPLFMILFRLPAGRHRSLMLFGVLLSLVHLDLESLELFFGVIPVPGILADLVLGVAAPAFTFVLPPTLGLWVMLVTCVLLQLPRLDLWPIGPTAAIDGNDSRGARP